MMFKSVPSGQIYVPGNVNILLIESMGENLTAIRTQDFVIIVAHTVDEVAQIVRTAHIKYHTMGEL
jgi:hypothetical protein